MKTFSEFINERTVPDYGVMNFTRQDGSNLHHIMVSYNSKTTQVIVQSSVPKSSADLSGTPVNLANHMFMHDGGISERSKKLKDGLIDAYTKSGGDPKKVLQSLLTITKVPGWKLAKHGK